MEKDKTPPCSCTSTLGSAHSQSWSHSPASHGGRTRWQHEWQGQGWSGRHYAGVERRGPGCGGRHKPSGGLSKGGPWHRG